MAVTGAIGDQQLITIALEMNNLLYNGYTKNVSTGDEYFKNYGYGGGYSIVRHGSTTSGLCESDNWY